MHAFTPNLHVGQALIETVRDHLVPGKSVGNVIISEAVNFDISLILVLD